jgi:hypothetical protein
MRGRQNTPGQLPTIIAARVRDVQGALSDVAEMVVRIID